MTKKTVFTAILMLVVFAAPARASEADVLHKLNELSAKQDQILQKLDAVQSELQIVKIRASQK